MIRRYASGRLPTAPDVQETAPRYSVQSNAGTAALDEGMRRALARANTEYSYGPLSQRGSASTVHGVVVLEQTGTGWAEWREHLAAAIARHGQPPGESAATAYYTAWLDALERLLATKGLQASS